MHIRKVSKQSEYDELTKSGIAIVDFEAAWCGPCKTLANIVADISTVPTFYFHKNREKIDSFTGNSSNKLHRR
jgi:hypothetical protein